MIKRIIKRGLKKFISSVPFVGSYFEGMITIFMLHRVYPGANRLYLDKYLKISPEFLDKFITELKSSGYEFISIDRVYEILKSGRRVWKKIAFTLDDGYLDNYVYAYPIFKKHSVPFTIYIVTSLLQRENFPWHYILEELIVEHDYIILSDGRKFDCEDKESKIQTYIKISEIIMSLDQSNLAGQIRDLLSNYNIDYKKKCEELIMSWDHVAEISKDELCTIGGHTKNHLVLNRLSEQEVIEEITDANKVIESKIGRKVEHFAYPFGGENEVGKREFEIVKKLNLKTATTGRRGVIYREHKNYLECLPRIMLTET